MKQILLIFILLAGIGLNDNVAARSMESSSGPASTFETTTPDEMDSMTPRIDGGDDVTLSNAETVKESVPAEKKQSIFRHGLIKWLRGWLHVIDQHGENADRGISGFLVAAPGVPDDLRRTLTRISTEEKSEGLFFSLLFAALVLIAGFVIELLFRKMTARLTSQLADFDPKSELGLGRLWGAMLHILPQLVHVTVFAFASVGIFILTHTDRIQPVRALFMAVLVAIVIARSIAIVSNFLFSSDIRGFRLIPVSDTSALIVHRSVKFLAWYIAFSLMFITLLGDLGAAYPTVQLMGLLLGSILIFMIVLMLLAKKKAVCDSILNAEPGEETSWLRRQFASFWYIPAVLYLFGIWLIWLNAMLSDKEITGGSLLISLLIVPSYLLLDQIAKWLVDTLVTTLNIFKPSGEKAVKGSDHEQVFEDAAKKEVRLKKHMLRLVRIFIAMVLVIWLLSLWGYTVPFASDIVRAVFDILVTLSLAVLLWRMTSGYIERKLAESYSDEEEEEIDDSGEFGAVKQRGRDYTILPMLRKFIASTLLVMVTLIILSSIGVNIGPLLAGAGVVGLAVGFGAQKLVSDVLSGIFYLLDDAFRVGEYIEAGSVKGTVETITLRNVMLRHHRGMLQIVPHSELGSITNYMRGGIIVKFNLEFPYDTNINMIRKIIKKVGQEMLEDPEMGSDFIKPLKSQGVREIADSVMVIRAKFTAQPGKHFLIRREAYRRITEALATKGIHYAHRKVIVEVPNLEEKKDTIKDDRIKQILEAGGAAGQITLDKGQEEEKGKNESPI